MVLLINDQARIFLELLLSAFLGAVIGLEREYNRKEAGLRTYSLVSLGSALFTIIGLQVMAVVPAEGGIGFDPSRTIAALVMGVGFIGAGTIIYRQSHVEGLTTAAGLWLTAAIGSGVAIHLYYPAIFTTFLAVGILSGLRIIEERYLKK